MMPWEKEFSNKSQAKLLIGDLSALILSRICIKAFWCWIWLKSCWKSCCNCNISNWIFFSSSKRHFWKSRFFWLIAKLTSARNASISFSLSWLSSANSRWKSWFSLCCNTENFNWLYCNSAECFLLNRATSSDESRFKALILSEDWRFFPACQALMPLDANKLKPYIQDIVLISPQ